MMRPLRSAIRTVLSSRSATMFSISLTGPEIRILSFPTVVDGVMAVGSNPQ